ncbi:hypothetical protein [Streptomyces sp. NPDC049744]|uniref:hypothetical protein n=1 Tax=Streptomyces sp. NPDC049744 TaxID=3154359 RepID=UPI0034146C96
MTRQLTTQNATITTAAVEVKTLTISGKQVTLAVFRQLKEEALIADDGTLNGDPWGVVNYHPDKCGGDQREHWHVVWQNGNDLRRARVDHIPHFDPDGVLRKIPAPFETREAGLLLDSSVLQWIKAQRDKCPLPKAEHDYRYNDKIAYKTAHEFSAPATASATALGAANATEAAARAYRWLEQQRNTDPGAGAFYPPPEVRARTLRDAEERLQKAREASDAATLALMQELRDGPGHAELLQEFRAACQAEADRRQQHRDSRAVIAELPQLFIAV